jgi:hypothetical protein
MILSREERSQHYARGTFIAIVINPYGRVEEKTYHGGRPIHDWEYMSYYEVLNDGVGDWCLVYQPPRVKRGSVNKWYKEVVGTIGVSIRQSIFLVPTMAVHEMWKWRTGGWVNPTYSHMSQYTKLITDHFRWKYHDGPQHAKEFDLLEFYRRQHDQHGWCIEMSGPQQMLHLSLEETPHHQHVDEFTPMEIDNSDNLLLESINLLDGGNCNEFLDLDQVESILADFPDEVMNQPQWLDSVVDPAVLPDIPLV